MALVQGRAGLNLALVGLPVLSAGDEADGLLDEDGE